MEIKKIFLYFSLAILLSGCFQSTAMVGPAITLASTGNAYHAGYSFMANRAVEQETGKTTTEHVTQLLEEANNNQQAEKELIKLVKSNFELTRKKIIFQNKDKFK